MLLVPSVPLRFKNLTTVCPDPSGETRRWMQRFTVHRCDHKTSVHLRVLHASVVIFSSVLSKHPRCKVLRAEDNNHNQKTP
jgi:hypothetical protein